MHLAAGIDLEADALTLMTAQLRASRLRAGTMEPYGDVAFEDSAIVAVIRHLGAGWLESSLSIHRWSESDVRALRELAAMTTSALCHFSFRADLTLFFAGWAATDVRALADEEVVQEWTGRGARRLGDTPWLWLHALPEEVLVIHESLHALLEDDDDDDEEEGEG